MQTEIFTLMPPFPGSEISFPVLRFGTPGARPKAYIQAALHADEVPAILVAQALKRLLQEAEEKGDLVGEVVLVPSANPIGLAQHVHGQHHGRFDLHDGVNFNRDYVELGELAATRLEGRLGQDIPENTRSIQDALREVALEQTASTTTRDLKNKLQALSADANLVLDLHCDSEARLHLYALKEQADIAMELAAFLGAEAVLLANESGGTPFDEAGCRPWLVLKERFAAHPIEMGCFGATVELRGQADTSHELAGADAQALMKFLCLRGVLSGPKPAVPDAKCAATPLSGSEPISAPHAGVVVFRARLGQEVRAGDLIADLVDPHTGKVTSVHCQSAGRIYATCGSRWAYAGKRLAKIAGVSMVRTGKLLSP